MQHVANLTYKLQEDFQIKYSVFSIFSEFRFCFVHETLNNDTNSALELSIIFVLIN